MKIKLRQNHTGCFAEVSMNESEFKKVRAIGDRWKQSTETVLQRVLHRAAKTAVQKEKAKP